MDILVLKNTNPWDKEGATKHADGRNRSSLTMDNHGEEGPAPLIKPTL